MQFYADKIIIQCRLELCMKRQMPNIQACLRKKVKNYFICFIICKKKYVKPYIQIKVPLLEITEKRMIDAFYLHLFQFISQQLGSGKREWRGTDTFKHIYMPLTQTW